MQPQAGLQITVKRVNGQECRQQCWVLYRRGRERARQAGTWTATVEGISGGALFGEPPKSFEEGPGGPRALWWLASRCYQYVLRLTQPRGFRRMRYCGGCVRRELGSGARRQGEEMGELPCMRRIRKPQPADRTGCKTLVLRGPGLTLRISS